MLVGVRPVARLRAGVDAVEDARLDLEVVATVRKVLVPGEWMRQMCEPYYGEAVTAWPVGIDTESWKPHPNSKRTLDFLLYDKVRWEHQNYERMLLEPIRQELRRCRFSYTELCYGYYQEETFRELLGKCRAMIFVCEHETQGIAYQQALACGVPILAWDRGGHWQDPEFYPQRVKFQPVTSVPYWHEQCGQKFAAAADFPKRLNEFWGALARIHTAESDARDLRSKISRARSESKWRLAAVDLCRLSLDLRAATQKRTV